MALIPEAGGTVGQTTRGVSGVTLTQFFSAVLQGLGAPVTANNLAKMGAIAFVEGHGGSYNPFNYILGPGSNFNSAGVKNYPDVQTGIAQTIRLLSQGNATAWRNNLLSDGAYSQWIDASKNFYKSWAVFPNVSQQSAAQKLNGILDGPPVSGGGASLGSAGAGNNAAALAALSASQGAPAAPRPAAMNAQPERDAFNSYLTSIGPEQAAKITNDLKSGMSLEDLGKYMSTAPAEVNRYIHFLATLDASGQNAEKNLLGPQDPAGSATMTSLLKSLGIDYSNAPSPTPALLAFLNGVGLNLSTAEDVRNRAMARIGNATTTSLADIERTSGRTKQNVTADLIRRGILSSGESNTRYARQAEDVGVQKAAVQTAAASGKEDVQTAYQSNVNTNKQQALDRIIGAEQDQSTARATSAAQEDSYRRMQEAAETANAAQLAAQKASKDAEIAALLQRGSAA